MKADDAQYYQDVITSANEANEFEKLVLFLQMTRSKVRDKAVNSEFIYTYAKVQDLSSLERFIGQPNSVNIIVFMDHLQDLIRHYEIGGHFAELINLLEQRINLDRAHQGIYTRLGTLYAKYKEQKLMEHVNYFGHV